MTHLIFNYETDPVQRMTGEDLRDMFPDMGFSEYGDCDELIVTFNMYGEPGKIELVNS